MEKPGVFCVDICEDVFVKDDNCPYTREDGDITYTTHTTIAVYGLLSEIAWDILEYLNLWGYKPTEVYEVTYSISSIARMSHGVITSEITSATTCPIYVVDIPLTQEVNHDCS